MMIRSQTKAIVAMDFHLPLNLIITVSSDMTIRLFDLTTYEQTIEFLSKVDSPLCIAAHPTLNIFSCGFASGNMCIFDIEKTCVTDQMNQLKKAVKKIAYSPCGSLLVACSEDGSTSLHNANRQHLPTKMMHLEFPPKHIHIAFSPLISKQKIRVADQTDTYREDMENNMSASNFDDEEQQTEEEQTEPGV
jgi:WD40 repeat protein